MVDSRSALSYTLYLGHSANDFPFGYAIDEVYGQTNYALNNTHLGLQTHAEGKWGSSSWHIGAEGYLFLRRNEESFLPDRKALSYADRSRKRDANAFAKLQYPLGDWALFSDLQLRYVGISLYADENYVEAEHIDIPTRTWLFFNPKVGLSYAPSPRLSLYTSVAVANREPTRNDILGDTQINLGTLEAAQDKDSVRPERVLDWELGVKGRQGPLQGGLNFFYMDFRDEIAPTGEYIPDFYAQLRQNLSRSRRIGVEGDFRMELGYGLQLSGLGYWMRARIEAYKPDGASVALENVPIGAAPELQLQLQTSYRPMFLGRRLSVFLRGRYYGPTYLNPIPFPIEGATDAEDYKEKRQQAPDQLFLDAGCTLSYPKLQLSLHLRNLLDTPYYPMGEVRETEDGPMPSYFAQAPLHLYGSLRIQVFEP